MLIYIGIAFVLLDLLIVRSACRVAGLSDRDMELAAPPEKRPSE